MRGEGKGRGARHAAAHAKEGEKGGDEGNFGAQDERFAKKMVFANKFS